MSRCAVRSLGTFFHRSGGLAAAFSIAAVLGVAAPRAAVGIEWNVPGPANFFDAANWLPMQVPLAPDPAFIRNGGTATADGTMGGNPTVMPLASLTVGDELGNGVLGSNDVDITIGPLNGPNDLGVGVLIEANIPSSGTVVGIDGNLSITDAASLVVEGALNVGETSAAGTAIAEGSGELTIERVTTVVIGGDFDVGTPIVSDNSGGDPLNGATATGNGTVNIRDVDTFTVAGDFDVGDGNVNNITHSGRGTVHQNATVLVERVDSFTIDACLDVGSSGSEEYETENALVSITFRDVGTLIVGSDIDYLNSGVRGTGAAAGVINYDGTVNFDNTTVVISSDIDLNYVEISGDGAIDAEGTMNLIDSALTLTGVDSADIGIIDFVNGNPGSGGGAPGNSVGAFLNLTRSSFVSPIETRVGLRLNGVPGNLDAEVAMDDASRVATALLEVGEGTFIVHLDGLTRVTDATVGAVDTYSAIDANDATLGGDFIADLDFIPPDGSHTFDLLVTTSLNSLNDTTAAFSVVDLPPGFMVDFFGVAQASGVDVVRLEISGVSPTGTPTSTPSSTPTATRVPIGGGCADASQCVDGAVCVSGFCEEAIAPAPATSATALALALAALTGIAGFGLARRRG